MPAWSAARYVVDVCANRALEQALSPSHSRSLPRSRRLAFAPRRIPDAIIEAPAFTPPPDPMARLQSLASEVAVRHGVHGRRGSVRRRCPT